LNKTYFIVLDKDPIKYSFFKNFSKEVYTNFEEMQNPTPDDKIFVFFSHDTDLEVTKRKIKKIEEKINSKNLNFFLQNKLKPNFEKKTNIIYYPININDLKSLTTQESNLPINYANIILTNNLIKNKNKDLFANVSDIEKNILKLLFFNDSIEKEVIKVSVLNYKSEIKSNSVDSHLTRIRNKIESIKANFKIVTSKKGVVSLTKGIN
tara:strand:+ start:559 stop:1182 length:624 start_codon:yes stop_codon:yes gene_type:complete